MRLELPGTSFSAWVVVDDTETDIFEPVYSNDKDGPVARCWIESKAGKNFAIWWRDSATKRPHTSSGDVHVDGVFGFSRRIYCKPGSKDTVHDNCVQISPTAAKLLTFSTLQTTDADCGLSQAETANIGEIKIKLSYVETRVSDNQDFRDIVTNSMLDHDKKVDERAKKAGSHRVQLGEEVKMNTYCITIVRTIAYIGTFIFHYRPRDILLAKEIIPRPAEQHRPPEPETANLTDGEEEDLASEINKLQKKLDDVRKTKRKRVKLEPEERSLRIKREKLNISFAQGEVLDLTELSD